MFVGSREERCRLKIEELCKLANQRFCYSFLLKAVLLEFYVDIEIVETMMSLAKNREIEEFEHQIRLYTKEKNDKSRNV